MSLRQKRQSITLAAGATKRLPHFACDGAQYVTANIRTDQDLSAWVAYGRTNTTQVSPGDQEPDVPAAEAGSASLPYATEAATVEANAGAEGGQGVRWELFGLPDVAQIVLHNPGQAEATIIVDGGLQ